MGWNEVDDKMKKHKDSYFVSCEEQYERAAIKRIIKEEFPWLSDSAVDAAIESCCRTIPAPHPRDKFLACLKQKLG